METGLFEIHAEQLEEFKRAGRTVAGSAAGTKSLRGSHFLNCLRFAILVLFARRQIMPDLAYDTAVGF